MTDIAFWDRIAEKYSKRPISDVDYYHQTLERTQSYLKATDRILEMGCGTGGTALLLAPHVAEVMATDLSPEMVRIAADKAAAEGTTNVRFAAKEVLEHSADDGPYDVVLAHNLLHLVENLDDALDHIARLVKPGGLFVSKTVVLSDTPSFGFKIMRKIIPVMQWLGKAPFVRFMPIVELERRIEASGFKIVEALHKDAMAPGRYVVARRL